MKAFLKPFDNPALPFSLENERSRIIVFRRFLGVIFLLFTVGLLLDFIFDFKNFGFWTFASALLLTAAFLLLSLVNVPHKYLLSAYIIILFLINQVNFILIPRAFHVLVYWVGLTPLFVAVLTKPPRIVLWTLVLLLFLILNGFLIARNIGSYEQTVQPKDFILGGSFFLLTTATIAFFFKYTEIKIKEQLFQKNSQLEVLAKKVEERNDELKHYNDHLEDRVHERTEELEQQNKQLAEYAFINSHLVRGPLARILGITSLISKTVITTEQKDLIAHLDKASSELDEVISNINYVLEKEEKFDREALNKLRGSK